MMHMAPADMDGLSVLGREAMHFGGAACGVEACPDTLAMSGVLL